MKRCSQWREAVAIVAMLAATAGCGTKPGTPESAPTGISRGAAAVDARQKQVEDRRESAGAYTPVHVPPRSGRDYATDAVRTMQADDAANPGMLWVERGAQAWRTAAGSAGKSCADCHGDAATSMRGVATRLPAIDAATGALTNLEGRINGCRVQRMGAPSLAYESDTLLGLTAFVAFQSRGMPLAVSIEGPARRHFEAGQRFYQQQIGQMNLACVDCHDRLAGRRLLAERISEGHPNAYPIYRLEWQAAGSLHRRFRSCLSGVRAELLPQGAPELVDLELFVGWRARGLPVETPGVRR